MPSMPVKSNVRCVVRNLGKAMMNIDERRIRVLYAAFRAGTMRSAADSLDVAPSSISRQIASLEAEMGVPLIEHGRRDVRLTEAGQRVINYYQDIETRRRQLGDDLSDLAKNRTGQVRIAIGEGFLGPAFYSALGELSATYPQVDLMVRVTDTADIIRMIADDQLHFGLVFHPVDEPKLISLFSARVPLKLLVRSTHPLSSRPSASLKDLETEKLALMDQRFRIRQIIDQAARESGASLQCAIETNSIAMLVEAARSNRATTILPEFSADHDIASGELKAIPLSDEALQPLYVHMIARAKRNLSEPARFLIERLRPRLGPITH